MVHEVEAAGADVTEGVVTPDFIDRVGDALQKADRSRRRRLVFHRFRRLLPLGLLIGPLVAWHLILAAPADAHVYIDALAWVAFFLDVAVHADTAILAYLGLSALPTVVGFCLFLLVTVTLLGDDRSHMS